MAETLYLKVTDTPTWWNKEAAIGLIGAGPLGAFVGGLIGKDRMERENRDGRAVSSTPSFWNKDTLLGGLLGNLTGALIGLGIATIILFSAEVLPSLAMVQLGASAMAVAGAAVGVYLGGKKGQAREQQEYAQAAQQPESAHQPAKSMEQSKTLSLTTEIERERTEAQQAEIKRAEARRDEIKNDIKRMEAQRDQINRAEVEKKKITEKKAAAVETVSTKGPAVVINNILIGNDNRHIENAQQIAHSTAASANISKSEAPKEKEKSYTTQIDKEREAATTLVPTR